MPNQKRSKRTFIKKGKSLGRYRSGSPYWDWLFNHQDLKSATNKLGEPVIANPDISEEGSLLDLYKHKKRMEEKKENLLYILKLSVERSNLTEQEGVILIEVFYKQRTLTDVAAELGISQPRVSSVIKKAVKKIKRVANSIGYKYGI